MLTNFQSSSIVCWCIKAVFNSSSKDPVAPRKKEEDLEPPLRLVKWSSSGLVCKCSSQSSTMCKCWFVIPFHSSTFSIFNNWECNSRNNRLCSTASAPPWMGGMMIALYHRSYWYLISYSTTMEISHLSQKIPKCYHLEVVVAVVDSEDLYQLWQHLLNRPYHYIHFFI